MSFMSLVLIGIAGLTLVTLVVTATGAGPDAVAQYIADVQTYVHPFSHIPYTPKEADRELSGPSALRLHGHCPLLHSTLRGASTQAARSDHSMRVRRAVGAPRVVGSIFEGPPGKPMGYC